MTCFSIVSVIIDALIICVCVAALLTMQTFSNMLWVTAVEVLVLSFLLILFGCIELCKMKSYLSYNEPRQKIHVSAVNDAVDDS